MFVHVPADYDFTAMDPASYAPVCHGFFLSDPKHKYKASSHIFPEEGVGCPAYDKCGPGIRLILLHMDAAAVAYVILYKDFAAPHAVGDCISCASVDNEHSTVHSVSRGVFGVPVYYTDGAAHEHP